MKRARARRRDRKARRDGAREEAVERRRGAGLAPMLTRHSHALAAKGKRQRTDIGSLRLRCVARARVFHGTAMPQRRRRESFMFREGVPSLMLCPCATRLMGLNGSAEVARCCVCAAPNLRRGWSPCHLEDSRPLVTAIRRVSEVRGPQHRSIIDK